MPIPKLFHFVYLGFTEFTYLHFLAVKTCNLVHQPHTIYVYTHFKRETNTTWWDQIQEYITVEWVDLPNNIFGNPVRKFQHMADVIRLEKLIQHGGVYLDLDVISLRPFGSLYQEKCVLGTQAPLSRYEGLCNAVILAEPGSEFLQRWYQEYRSFQSGRWDFHSVKIPLLLSRLYGSLLRILDSKKFFPVTWKDTDFMCNRSFDGAVKNSYVVHLWDSIWGKDHLLDASPELLTRNTTFSYCVNQALKPRHTETKPQTLVTLSSRRTIRLPIHTAKKATPPDPKPTKMSEICQELFKYQKPIHDIITQPTQIVKSPLNVLRCYLQRFQTPSKNSYNQQTRSIIRKLGSYNRYLHLKNTDTKSVLTPSCSTTIPTGIWSHCHNIPGYIGVMTLKFGNNHQEVLFGDQNGRESLYRSIGIEVPGVNTMLLERFKLATIHYNQHKCYFLEGTWVLPTTLMIYLMSPKLHLTWKLEDIRQTGINQFIKVINPVIHSMTGLITNHPIYPNLDSTSIYKMLQTRFPNVQFILVDTDYSKIIKIAYLQEQDFYQTLVKLQIPHTCQLYGIKRGKLPYISKMENHQNDKYILIPTKWILPLQTTYVPELFGKIYLSRGRFLKYLRNSVETSLI